MSGEAFDIAIDHGFPLFVAEATVWKGWATTSSGDPTGPPLLRAGLEDYRSSGTEMFVPHHLVLLAEALRHLGDAEGALDVVTEARAHAATSGCLDHEVEAIRLQALLGADRGAPQGDTAQLLRDASDVATNQGAVGLGVRVAASWMELELVADQPTRLEEARRSLATACGQVPEGADSPELEAARGLVSQRWRPMSTAG